MTTMQRCLAVVERLVVVACWLDSALRECSAIVMTLACFSFSFQNCLCLIIFLSKPKS